MNVNAKITEFLKYKAKGYNFFNRSSKMESKPENLYLYTIMLRFLAVEEDALDKIDNIKKILDNIQSKSGIFYYDEVINKEIGEKKSKKMISKFDREPKKVKLGLFISNINFNNYIINNNGDLNYELLKESILQEFFQE